ncbi:MAG: FliM/FliN family flagellar motor switch protein [Vitreimonas sp.]
MSVETFIPASADNANQPTAAPPPRLNNRLIENVDVKLETYLGATSMTIAALNELRAGSVIALDAGLTEVVELRLNGVAIAHGELVAVGDKFGVRITAIAT